MLSTVNLAYLRKGLAHGLVFPAASDLVSGQAAQPERTPPASPDVDFHAGKLIRHGTQVRIVCRAEEHGPDAAGRPAHLDQVLTEKRLPEHVRVKRCCLRLDDHYVLAVQAAPTACSNLRRIPDNDHAVEVAPRPDPGLFLNSPELLIENALPAKFVLPEFPGDG